MSLTFGQVLLEAPTPGGYVSIYKAVAVLLLLLIWTRLLTWTDKDAVAAHLPRETLNIANLAGLVLGFFLFFYIQITFFLAFLIPFLIFAIEAGVYLTLRHKAVGLSDLKDQFQAWLRSFKKEKAEKDLAFALELFPKSGPAMGTPGKEDPARPSYEAAQFALTDPLRKNAEQVDLAPSQSGVSVKYTVDGVGYDGPTIDGSNGAGAISLFKGLGGMEVEERRKPQTGMMKVALDGAAKRDVKLQTAGTTAGEYLRMMFDPGKRFARSLEQLGFTESQLGMLQSSIRDRSGVVLVCTPKQQGLTSMLYAIIRAHDVYMEHVHSIERDPDQDLEGITQNKLPGNASGADELKQVDWVISQEPDVIMINKLEDPRSAASLVRFATEGKRVYVGMRAGSSAEAVEQWRKLAGEDDPATLDVLKLVIVGRVLRKLCMACKESYAPDPNTLKKLNLNPEKVTTLFKARETQLRDPKGNPIPCTFCHDLRFQGRTGVFEFLIVDDDVREALRRDFAANGRPSSQFKAAFRKKGLRYLQEEALTIVERGDTSVQEVLRVLRGPDDAQPTRRSSSAAPAAARTRPPTAPQPS
jgi:type II secretory ATPase GspE/PulE/Tfp pilus assembly ATPase PilB-like protein